MKLIKRLLKWFFGILGILILTVLTIGLIFLYTSPQFGGTVSEKQKEEYAKTGHYRDGIFLNEEVINMELNCHSLTAMIKEMFNPNPRVAPDHNIEVAKINKENINNLPDSVTRTTWLGHSSFLIETGGKTILIDPIFGQYAAPHPLLGRARFNREMPISIEDLEHIDVIIISHDHYDHLDYPSIDSLKGKVDHFFVPLGVGNHLKRWNIQDDRISELDWWQEEQYENLRIVLTPSRHMSGRGLGDQSATLWGSWIIQNKYSNIYFSGDGGYGKHFKEIGDKYGPFDIGLMECGQYNELWKGVHMMPEESVQAAVDLKAGLIVPIHWGSFALATHSWTDPVERITKAAKKIKFPIATPRLGEQLILSKMKNMAYKNWWEN